MTSTTVHTGFWINWNDRGHAPRLTLTVSPTYGPYLISFVALSVGVAIGQLWTIICFAIHQIRSTTSDRNAHWHQVQCLLRNGTSSTAFLWMLSRLSHAREKGAPHLKHTICLATLALTHISVMSVAGISSSRAILAGHEVLARGTSCGWISNGTNITTILDFGQDTMVATYLMGRSTATNALKYVHDCYNATSLASSGSCGVYTVPAINITTKNRVPCPFGQDICGLPYAIEVDTGLIDSSAHIGINTKPSGRIRFRKVLTCVPILPDRYVSGWESVNFTAPQIVNIPGNKWKQYDLGAIRGGFNSNATSFISKYGLLMGNSGCYNLGYVRRSCTGFVSILGILTTYSSVTSYSGHLDDGSFSDFLPIPELRAPNSDIVLLSIISKTCYSSKVLDPWFQATITNDSSLADLDTNYIGPWGPKVFNWYYPDRVQSGLACTEQYQFCNNTYCSRLDGLYADLYTPYLGLTLNNDQKATFNLILNATFGLTVDIITLMLGDQLLLAQDKVLQAGEPLSGPLPQDQWEAEVANIVNVMLAALQRRIVDYVSPPDVSLYLSNGPVSSLSFITPPDTEAATQMCNIVRIRNPAYFNFSVVGLTVVLFLGLSIIFVNICCLPRVAFWARRKLRCDTHPQDEWNEGHLLRLQRTAFESHGIGPWEVDGKGGIPSIAEAGLQFSADRAWRWLGKTT